MAELIQGDMLKRNRDGEKIENQDQEVIKLEEKFFFSPSKGNVAFASATDGWAFTLNSFAPRIAKQFGMNPKVLTQFLWGKYYF